MFMNIHKVSFFDLLVMMREKAKIFTRLLTVPS